MAARRLLRPFQFKLMFLIYDLPAKGDYVPGNCNFNLTISHSLVLSFYC